MLIVNDEQRLQAGIGSLSKRCSYCSKAPRAYPLFLSDEAKLAVYHAACAAALATEILVELYTFLSPPAPYERLFFAHHIRRRSFPAGRCGEGVTGGRVTQQRILKGGVGCTQPTFARSRRLWWSKPFSEAPG